MDDIGNYYDNIPVDEKILFKKVFVCLMFLKKFTAINILKVDIL